MNKKNKNCFIIGGGPVGILASIILIDKYKNVTVVEKSKKLGGLLSSIQDNKGTYYDYGTHIPNLTNIKELDNILFGKEELRKENWLEYNSLLTKCYFNGQWNHNNSFLDARALSNELYEKGIVDFFHANDQFINTDNLKKILTEKFGKTFAELIFKPSLEKLMGEDYDQLESFDAIKLFGLNRLIILTAEMSKKLKTIELFNEKIGYHTNIGSSQKHLYPASTKGCGFWVDSLVNQAKEKGVRFINGSVVEKITLKDKKITSINLTNRSKADCSLLVWTIPPVLALRAARINYSSPPPKFRTSSLFHFSINKQLLIKDAYYVWCMDQRYKSFRITLYPNLNPNKNRKFYSLTVEILSTLEGAKDIKAESVFKELILLGIVSDKSKIISSKHQIMENTFPVPKLGYIKNIKEIAQLIDNKISNIEVFGRSKGTTWFMNDVFKDVFNTLKNYD